MHCPYCGKELQKEKRSKMQVSQRLYVERCLMCATTYHIYKPTKESYALIFFKVED